jgi:hypothetical protein
LRILFGILSGLIVSSAALAQSDAPAGCALREPAAPHARGLGTVLEIQNAAVARADIPRRELVRGGALDPRYLNDQRAVVRQDNGAVDTYDVPVGMTVHVGDRVKLQGSYRSDNSKCSYVPILAIPDDAPAA